jgi:hypothetical protein
MVLALATTSATTSATTTTTTGWCVTVAAAAAVAEFHPFHDISGFLLQRRRSGCLIVGWKSDIHGDAGIALV